jgi:hypothetical protein
LMGTFGILEKAVVRSRQSSELCEDVEIPREKRSPFWRATP